MIISKENAFFVFSGSVLRYDGVKLDLTQLKNSDIFTTYCGAQFKWQEWLQCRTVIGSFPQPDQKITENKLLSL